MGNRGNRRRGAGSREAGRGTGARREAGGTVGATQTARNEGADAASGFGALGLSQQMVDAAGAFGYIEPTPVQRAAIPAVLAGRDVLAAAQTGTGKTAAFLLPLLARLGSGGRAPRRRGAGDGRGRAAASPRALVVTPTRELAQQILQVARGLARGSGHRVEAVVGGVGYESQHEALRQAPDILVATPGRLLDLLSQGATSLAGVEALVLDEADRMLDMGFLPDVRRIVAQVPAHRQTLLFSATLAPEVVSSVSDLVKDPVRVEIAPVGTTAETVEQYVLGVAPEAKKRALVEVLRREGSSRVIVFVRGKHRADHLSRVLCKKGFSSMPIHGDRTQNQRTRALARFASGEVGVLVATDVLSRGIDVDRVAYVVNLDVPREPQDYVHRIGRTGRAGERGWSLTFCAQDEYDNLRAVERLTGMVIESYPRAEGIDVGEDAPVLDPGRTAGGPAPRKRSRRRGRRR